MFVWPTGGVIVEAQQGKSYLLTRQGYSFKLVANFTEMALILHHLFVKNNDMLAIRC